MTPAHSPVLFLLSCLLSTVLPSHGHRDSIVAFKTPDLITHNPCIQQVPCLVKHQTGMNKIARTSLSSDWSDSDSSSLIGQDDAGAENTADRIEHVLSGRIRHV